MLDNLLGNAWKFTSKHEQARVEVGMVGHGGQPAYFIQDDGAGFDIKTREKLFDAARSAARWAPRAWELRSVWREQFHRLGSGAMPRAMPPRITAAVC